MPFAGGPISFQRFFIDGQLPDSVDDAFIQQLSQRTFGRVAAQSDGSHIGWIGPRHLFDTEPDAAGLAVGRFAHFALRIDTNRVPPAVARSYRQQEEQTALEAAGRDFLTRAERRAAKEAAEARADQELRAGHFRRLAAYPVLLDLQHKTLYLGALGAGVADRCLALFADTFSARLNPADVDAIALTAAKTHDLTRPLEHVTPTHFVPPPADQAAEANDFNTNHAFLGRELLTWLWYQVQEKSSPLQLAHHDDVSLAFARTLRLDCDYGLTGCDTITAPCPIDLPEARAALAIGKQPTKAGLVLGTALGEFQATLDAQRWTVSSAVLPEISDELDTAARLEARFDLIADLATLLDSLFERFLTQRLARAWEPETRTITNWIRGPQTPQALSA